MLSDERLKEVLSGGSCVVSFQPKDDAGNNLGEPLTGEFGPNLGTPEDAYMLVVTLLMEAAGAMMERLTAQAEAQESASMEADVLETILALPEAESFPDRERL